MHRVCFHGERLKVHSLRLEEVEDGELRRIHAMTFGGPQSRDTLDLRRREHHLLQFNLPGKLEEQLRPDF